MAELTILADGGGPIGFGHLMRCRSVADAWEYGPVRLIARMEGDLPPPQGWERSDWLNTLPSGERVLVDSYVPEREWFLRLRERFAKVTVLDDFDRLSYPVDLVICPNAYGKNLEYQGQTGQIAGGPEYLLLRNEILNARPKPGPQVMVTFGGASPEKLFQWLLPALKAEGIRTVAVTGSQEMCRKLSGELSGPLTTILGWIGPEEMAERMAATDVAVTAAGQSLNEFTALGVPAVAVQAGEDQQYNMAWYVEQGLLEELLLPEDPEMVKKVLFQVKKKRGTRVTNPFSSYGNKQVCKAIYARDREEE